MLELSIDFNLSGTIPLAVYYLKENEATLLSIPERQYDHLKHNDFSFFKFINLGTLGLSNLNISNSIINVRKSVCSF